MPMSLCPCSCFDGDPPVDLGRVNSWKQRERIGLRTTCRVTSVVDLRFTGAKDVLGTPFRVRAVEMPGMSVYKMSLVPTRLAFRVCAVEVPSM